MTDLIGRQLGPYTIKAELGTGGMGTVYLAETLAEGGMRRQVALKVVHPHLLATPGFFKRFLREAEIGKSVHHDNVVRTFDVDALAVEGEQHHFLVMEFVEGQTLRELLGELGTLPEGLCRHIGREIANGLAAIHAAGVIHRDLKPENVLVTADHVVKIMDLGVARLRDEALRLSQSGGFVGSVHYTAPEQFQRLGTDARADHYALGLILYELATGRYPFSDDDFAGLMRAHLNEEPRPVSDANPRLSAFFEEVVKALLVKDRDQRLTAAHRVLAEGEQGEWWRKRARKIRADTRRPLRRTRIPRETALYGRAAETDALRSLYESAVSGVGRALLIEGEAGVGKTRLVHDFVVGLQREGEDLNFLFGSYPPGGAATAAGGFSTAYREHFGEAGCAEYLRDMPSLVPAFDAVLRGEAPPEGEGTLTTQSLHTAFVHATRALAAERPTILLIEDLHLAPEEGRAVFAALALAVPHHRILLVGERRTVPPDQWLLNLSRLEHVSHMKIGRLGPDACRQLLAEIFRSERLADELGPQIVTKSDGNPFFMLEIVQGLREADQLGRNPDGSWFARHEVRKIAIPSSVLDIIRVRLAFLDAQDRRLLDAACCCGFEFDPQLVAEALEMPQIPAIQRLARVEAKHRLVRSVGRRFAFDQHQVQEALYEALEEDLRRELHGALAGALEARARGDVEGAVAVELCEHFFGAAQPERALGNLTSALDHLSRGHLNDAAVALADRALKVPDLLEDRMRLDVLLRKVRWIGLLGRREEERATLGEALDLATKAGDEAAIARVQWRFGLLELHVSSFESARQRFEQALGKARGAGHQELTMRALSGLGVVSTRMGRPDEAREQHEKAAALARESGYRQGEAMAAGNLGHVYWSQGSYAKALALFERDLAICREQGDQDSEAQSALNLGVIFRVLGRASEARAHYELALSLMRQVGDRRGEAIGRANLANVLLDLGRSEEARLELESSLRLSREIEYRGGEVAALMSLGNLQAHEGQEEAARASLAEALPIARSIGDAGSIVMLTASLAALPGGDSEAALHALAQHEQALQPRELVDIRFQLWKATGEFSHLAESHRLLCELRDRAPEECRASMIENVPLHRDVLRKWEQQMSERA